MSFKLFHIYKEGDDDYCIPISSSKKIGSMGESEVSYISNGDETHKWSIESDTSPWDSEKLTSIYELNFILGLFKFIFKKDLK